MKYNIGDRVKCIVSKDRVPLGNMGTIVAIDLKYQPMHHPKRALYAVCWDGFGNGHNMPLNEKTDKVYPYRSIWNVTRNEFKLCQSIKMEYI